MATFKVGQRVRIARWDESVRPEYRNAEVIYLRPYAGKRWMLPSPLIDCWLEFRGREMYGYTGYLEPLEDPRADAFLESIRKMKPYEEPTFKERTRELQERAFKSSLNLRNN